MFIGYSTFILGFIYCMVSLLILKLIVSWLEWLAKNNDTTKDVINEPAFKFMKKFGYSAIIIIWTIQTIVVFALSPAEYHDIGSIESPVVQEEVQNTKIVEPELYTSKDHKNEIHKSLDDTVNKELESLDEYIKDSSK